jgi:SUKH superfamily protein
MSKRQSRGSMCSASARNLALAYLGASNATDADQMTKEMEAIVAPPDTPLEVPSPEDWSRCERALRLSLPNDYRALIERYGTVVYGDFISIFNPKAKSTYFNLVDQAERIPRGERELRDKYGSVEVPYRLFPELGGLLPFGYTGNGDTILWLTRGMPSRWTVVVNGSRSSDYEELPMNTTSFLAGVLSGRVSCSLFPDDFPDPNPRIIIPPYLST